MNLNDSLQDAIKLLRGEGQHDLADAVVVAAVVVVLSETDKKQNDARERAAAHLYVESLARRASEHGAPPAQAACSVVKQDLTTEPAKPDAVRLRNELRERTEFEAWAQSIGTAIDADEHGNYLDGGLNYAKLGWQAALAATGKQQVGEVQGLDVEQLKNLVSSVHRTVSLGHQRGPHAYSGEDFGRYLAEAARDCRQIMGLLDALAARQPDGQDVVPYREALIQLHHAYDSGRKGLGYTRQVESLDDAIIAAPPAQAVDLEQFRAVVLDRRMEAVADGKHEAVQECDRLLALIDGKAVQS